MGTTLTGTTPQDTYDSLIKVTDNGPLSGTAKYLSDGLGNDSALALSTSGVGIGTTSLAAALDIRKDSGVYELVKIQNNTAGALYRAVGLGGGSVDFGADDTAASTAIFRTAGSERMRIDSSGNVGIGTSNPSNRVQSRRDATTDSSNSQFVAETRTGTVGQYAIYASRFDDGTGAGFTPIAFGAVQTAAAGRTGDFVVSVSNTDNVNLSTHERLRITSTGNVGIGTSSPSYQLDLQGGTTNNSRVRLLRGTDDTGQFMVLGWDNISLHRNVGLANAQTTLSINQVGSDGTRTPFYISGTGNVGIGLTNPIQKFGVSDGTNAFYVTHDANGPYLQAVNNANTVYKRQTYDAVDHVFLISASERARVTANGLTFNGDAAAANALSDYEQGTWTMGISFGGASTGVTYSLNTGTYTKIGRQVTVNGVVVLTSKGSSTGAVTITGLPFTVGNAFSFFSPATLKLINVSFANQFQGNNVFNQTFIELQEITEAGAVTNITDADFANNSEVMVSMTYFV